MRMITSLLCAGLIVLQGCVSQPPREPVASTAPPPPAVVKTHSQGSTAKRYMGVWFQGLQLHADGFENDVVGVILDAGEGSTFPIGPEEIEQSWSKAACISMFRSAREGWAQAEDIGLDKIVWVCARIHPTGWQLAVVAAPRYDQTWWNVAQGDDLPIGGLERPMTTGATIVLLPPPFQSRGLAFGHPRPPQGSALWSSAPQDLFLRAFRSWDEINEVWGSGMEVYGWNKGKREEVHPRERPEGR